MTCPRTHSWSVAELDQDQFRLLLIWSSFYHLMTSAFLPHSKGGECCVPRPPCSNPPLLQRKFFCLRQDCRVTQRPWYITREAQSTGRGQTGIRDDKDRLSNITCCVEELHCPFFTSTSEDRLTQALQSCLQVQGQIFLENLFYFSLGCILK